MSADEQRMMPEPEAIGLISEYGLLALDARIIARGK